MQQSKNLLVRGALSIDPAELDELRRGVLEQTRKSVSEHEEWVETIEGSTSALEKLVDDVPEDEQVEAALAAYVDAEGQVQTRHNRLRGL